MGYATVDDLKQRYPEKILRELTDESGNVINDPQLEQALADASDEIDAYLMGRYTLPLASPPRVLVRYACEIAMYLLMKLSPHIAIEDAQKRYDDAMKYLTRVSKGDVQLGLADDGTAAPQGDGPLVVGADRVFTRDAMRGL